LHDAGETNALLPVMETLERRGQPYAILAASTARQLLAQHPRRVPDALDIAQADHTQPPAQAMQLRAKAQAQYEAALQARQVVVGLASAYQTQWAQWFRSTGRQAIGYLDSLSVLTQPGWWQSFSGALSQMWLPTARSAEKLAGLLPQMPLRVMGQPALEAPLPEVPAAQLAMALGGPLDAQRPVWLWVGGRDVAYQQALGMFCQALRQQWGQMPLGSPPPQIVVSPHPGMNGLFETQTIAHWGLGGLFRVLPPGVLPTTALLPWVQRVWTQGSTVGAIAALHGKPVRYVGMASHAEEWNPLEVLGLVPRLATPEAIQTEMAAAAWQAGAPDAASTVVSAFQPGVAQQLGLPRQAAQAMADALAKPPASNTA
jgi:hypothetical protein